MNKACRYFINPITGKLFACLFFLVLSFSLSADDKTVKLQVLATSDTHGWFVPYNYPSAQSDFSGSLAQDYTLIKALRKECPDTLLVDNGDILQDNFQFLFMTEKASVSINPMINAMNFMGYDLINLGNHEFNEGVPILKKTMSKFQAADKNPDSVLCANLYDNNGKRIFAPYKIITTKSGIKVGFIGTVSPNISRWDAGNLKDYKVTDPVVETQNISKEIRDKVDILIAVAHMGLENEYDVNNSGIKYLAAGCPSLDLIICGHFHVIIDNDYYFNGKIYSAKEVTPEIKNKGILIVEPNCFGKGISQVLFTLSQEDGKFVIKDKAEDITSKYIPVNTIENGKKVVVQPDEELVKELAQFDKTAKDYGNSPIGKLEGGDLVPPGEIKGIPECFLGPTPLTYLMNVVGMYYGKQIADGKNIDVAACTILSSDANIKEGTIKRSDLAKVYKYFNTLYVIQISGTQLKKFMEWSADFYNQYKQGDLTVSFNPGRALYTYVVFNGINYKIDISQPAGNRIKDLTKSDGSPVNDNDMLLLAVNSYIGSTCLLQPGAVFKKDDTLPVLVGNSDNVPSLYGEGIKDFIEKYIVGVDKGILKADYIKNWSITGTDWNKEQHEKAVKLINEGILKINSTEKSFNSSSVTYDQIKNL